MSKNVGEKKIRFLAMLFALAAIGVAFAGPVASATWTGSVEFRNLSESFTYNASVIDSTVPPGLTVIVR